MRFGTCRYGSGRPVSSRAVIRGLNPSTQRLGEHLAWFQPAERLSRPAVELGGDGVEVGLVVGGEVGALGEVLAQEAVGVLVAAPLPGAVGVAEVDGHAGVDREL